MNKNRLAKINAIYLAFCPLGRIYEVFHATSLSGAITFLLIVLNIIYLSTYVKNRQKELGLLITLTIVGFFSSVVNLRSFDFVLYLNNLYPLAIFTAGLVLSSNIDIISYKKALIIIGLIVTFFCLLQMYQLITNGYFDNYYIPELKLSRENADVTLRVRPYSLLSEPAHLAIYLLPIFYYTLSNKYYILSGIFALGLLCSGSTTGLLLLALVFLVTFKLSFKNIVLYSLLALLVVALLNHFSVDILLNSIDKLERSDSNDIRLLGALDYVKHFSFGNWFLGTGFNQVDNFLKLHGVTNYSGNTFVTGNYAPAILFVFICYGLIGELIFLNYLKYLWVKYKNNIGYLVIFGGVICSDQVLYNENLLFIWVFVLMSNEMVDNNKPYKFIC